MSSFAGKAARWILPIQPITMVSASGRIAKSGRVKECSPATGWGGLKYPTCTDPLCPSSICRGRCKKSCSPAAEADMQSRTRAIRSLSGSCGKRAENVDVMGVALNSPLPFQCGWQAAPPAGLRAGSTVARGGRHHPRPGSSGRRPKADHADSSSR